MIARLRLIDAVAIAAGAMLFLKILGIASGSHASDVRRLGSVRALPDQSRPFADALTRARTNFAPEVQTTGTLAEEPTAASAPAAAGAASEAVKDPTPVPASAAERAILERLGERRDEWQQKGKDLEMRERLLENAERKLEARIGDLKAAEEKVENAKRPDGDGTGLKNLVIMYESMKPKEAARVFDRLSHDVLVPVVLQMNPRKMSEVLAVMTPDAAEKLTVALASRAKGRTEAVANAKAGAAPLPANELPAIDPLPARR